MRSKTYSGPGAQVSKAGPVDPSFDFATSRQRQAAVMRETTLDHRLFHLCPRKWAWIDQRRPSSSEHSSLPLPALPLPRLSANTISQTIPAPSVLAAWTWTTEVLALARTSSQVRRQRGYHSRSFNRPQQSPETLVELTSLSFLPFGVLVAELGHQVVIVSKWPKYTYK